MSKKLLTMPPRRGFSALGMSEMALSPQLSEREEAFAARMVVDHEVFSPGEPMRDMLATVPPFSAAACLNRVKNDILSAGQTIYPSEWPSMLKQEVEDYLAAARTRRRLPGHVATDILAFVEGARRQLGLAAAAEALHATHSAISSVATGALPELPLPDDLRSMEATLQTQDEYLRARESAEPASSRFGQKLIYPFGAAGLLGMLGALTGDLNGAVALTVTGGLAGIAANYFLRGAPRASALARYALELYAPVEQQLGDYFTRVADHETKREERDYARTLLTEVERLPAWRALLPLRKAGLLRVFDEQLQEGGHSFFRPADPGCELLDGASLAEMCFSSRMATSQIVRFAAECIQAVRVKRQGIDLCTAAASFREDLQAEVRHLMGKTFTLTEVVTLMSRNGLEKQICDRLVILAGVASAAFRHHNKAHLHYGEPGVFEAAFPGGSSNTTLVDLVHQVRPEITTFHEPFGENSIELIWHAANLLPANSQLFVLGGDATTVRKGKG